FFQGVPLKPKEEFEITLEYSFKHRPPVERKTSLSGALRDRRHGGTSLLPYVVLNLKLLALEQPRMRMLVSTNLDQRAMYKKVNVQETVELRLGFTDDLIDRVGPHQYTVTFQTLDRKPVSKILIKVEEDGSFLVNGEKRGRF